MKSIRCALLTGLALLLSAVPFRLSAADTVAATSPATKLYVKIDSPDLLNFHDYRLSRVDSSELVLTTLKNSAAAQARFAGYPGEVIVLDENAKAPDGAAVLLLVWDRGVVTATFQQNGREKFLGVVSRTPLSTHPDYSRMRQDIDQGLREYRHDAHLRATTQMNLYQALLYLRNYQAKG